MNPVERILSLAGGLLLVVPGITTDIVGVAIITLVIIWQYFSSRKNRTEAKTA